jgi:RNA-directed DNA polymerase
MMHGHGQSDSPVVPSKFPNKAGPPAAEGMEGRGLAKGNPSQQTAPRAQDRVGAPSALERVRQVAEQDRQVRFTTLLHHVYNVEHLRAAYHALKRDAAPGIDGETWEHYGQALEENLADLSGRLKRGAYRARPVKRTYIPKADGRLRPLGIPTIAAYCGVVPHRFRLAHGGTSVSPTGRPTIARPLRASSGRRSRLHL